MQQCPDAWRRRARCCPFVDNFHVLSGALGVSRCFERVPILLSPVFDNDRLTSAGCCIHETEMKPSTKSSFVEGVMLPLDTEI